MLNLMCGASKQRVATVYPVVCDGHGFGGAPRVRGYGSERPGGLRADDGGQVVQREVFGSQRRRIRPVHRKPVHREEGVDTAASLRVLWCATRRR